MRKTTFAIVITAALIASGSAGAAVSKKSVPAKKINTSKSAPLCPIKPAAKPAAKPVVIKPLLIGDPAPALKVSKWLKGQPIAKFEPGNIYVVEFWATWCGPCRQSIPHITELAKKYEGKITFIGVDVFDNTDSTTQAPYGTLAAYADSISKFVNEQGDKMVYSVGLDDLKNTMGDTWMKAAKQTGIPTAFVVNKDGRIALICHPMEIDAYLEQIVAGTFDSKAYAEKKIDEQVQAEKMQKLFARAGEFYKQNKFKETIEEIDKVLVSNPEYEGRIAPTKFSLLLQTDEPAAYVYARKMAAGCSKNDPEALTMIAGMIVSTAELKAPDYDLALSTAEQAAKITNSQDPSMLALLAQTNFKKGNIDKAIELQQSAIKLMENDKTIPETYTTAMKARLTEYQDKKAGK